MVTVSARIPRSQRREHQRLAEARGVNKSSVVRFLLGVAIRKTRLREALNLVREQKVSLWKATLTAGIDYLSARELKRELDELSRNQ